MTLAIGIAVFLIVGGGVLFWLRHAKLANESGPQRQDRGLAKLRPFFRREVVESKVRSSFPNENPADVFRLLDDDLPDVWGLERLQLAILKLSNGDLNSLRAHIAAARRDFLQVIGSAEYPGALEIGLDRYVRLPNPEQEAIHQRDMRQYLRWLKTRQPRRRPTNR